MLYIIYKYIYIYYILYNILFISIIEFSCKDHIVQSYSHKTNRVKIVVKQKGITLDMANDEVVNFDTMRDMVLNGGTIKSTERFQFKWGTLTKDNITQKVLQDNTNDNPSLPPLTRHRLTPKVWA